MSFEIDYKKIFELLPGIHLVIDKNFNIIDSSDSFQALEKKLDKKINNKNLLELYKENINFFDYEKLQQSFNKINDCCKKDEIEIKVYLNRHEKIFRINHALLNHSNKLILHSIQDITNYRKIQKIQIQEHQLTEGLLTQAGEMEREISQHVQMTKLKNSFIANVSHEFRTPIHGILGFAKLLLKNSSPTKQKEFIEHILSCGNHLNSLISNVLDLSKMEAGKVDIILEEIKIPQLIKNIKKIFKTAMAEKHIVFHTEYDGSLDLIYNDLHKLNQIIYNYMANAIKFSPSHSKISLIIRRKPDDKFCLMVTDTGIGIHQDNLHKLFVEFQQLDHSITKQYQGTGLGLAIVKKLTTLLGGEVGVASELNKGSTFSVTFPCRIIKRF